ncbi:MAG: NAD(P)-dependent oxidoreductase [Rhodospirillaceae bacterium]|jgi:uronate dehydrogenase|nr:NAD(P)-dependent oxidoreductase [Rhodospirillaceae bacterium]MBT5193909.1 NAD(P)-dependent oxidoreductase [Rhodospirillaceae bacterium]MBT5898908.1 NAD(P)-dependent oxidoreductase [Rhodospirillaceae bacterium]MBT6430049.1 NAD(P)-dependent oxidoreductase [Rhodospirillaceae bacterium]MBT7760031.1 NAD(P)-dependent oxidoreductase [Rhodospirillaceae bacterium]
METVLITGAAGGIGGRMRQLLKGVYPRLILSDRETPKNLTNEEEFIAADLADMAAMTNLLQGVDGVLHLGGQAMEASWDIIHQANIVGCHNLFEAARINGTRRVVFASSNHAIGFYPRHARIGVDHKVRPDSLYGVSKAFGEAVGSYYADNFGLGVMAIRIGNIDDHPVDERRLSIWISPRDLTQLVRIGLEHPDLVYEVVWGISDNARSWWDNEAARRLGYRPQDKAEDHRDHALAAETGRAPNSVGDYYQGGDICAEGYSGRPIPEES